MIILGACIIIIIALGIFIWRILLLLDQRERSLRQSMTTYHEALATTLKEQERLLYRMQDATIQSIERSRAELVLRLNNMIAHVHEENTLMTGTRDQLTSCLEDLRNQAGNLTTLTELMFKDHELMLTLLKAGLMNDLIKDINAYAAQR